MAFDERLAERVRQVISERTDFYEQKMFGGLAFMVNTHMACGLIRDDLMVRVGKDNHDEALARGAQEMDFTGRTMRGMVLVPASVVAADDVLVAWVDEAVAFAKSQPAKPPKAPKAPRSKRQS